MTDTVTLVRSAIGGVLRVVDEATPKDLRERLRRDDPYDKTGKPACAWDDAKARAELVDALTQDAHAILLALDGQTLVGEVTQAMTLLATVVGQDIEEGTDGLFRIVRGVAPDRVLSTVDPDARHGHKTASRSFDGYKGHVAVDADSEIITATEVTAGNEGDASAAEAILADVLTSAKDTTSSEASSNHEGLGNGKGIAWASARCEACSAVARAPRRPTLGARERRSPSADTRPP